jgi:hypothetical protein
LPRAARKILVSIGHRRPLLPGILDRPFLISLLPRASGQSRRNGVKGASPCISPACEFVKELCSRVPLSWSSLQEEKLSHAGCTRSAFFSLCLRGRPLDVLWGRGDLRATQTRPPGCLPACLARPRFFRGNAANGARRARNPSSESFDPPGLLQKELSWWESCQAQSPILCLAKS